MMARFNPDNLLNKGNGFSFALRVIAVLIALSLSAWFLLAMAYCIPSSWMAHNAASSAAILEKEGLRPSMHFANDALYDNFTDARMLNEALFAGDRNPLANALECNEYADGDTHILKLKNAAQAALADEPTVNEPTFSYVRYWHAYLIYLKPLLCLTDINGIRQLMHVIFLCVLAVLCSLLMSFKRTIAMILVAVVSFSLYGAAAAASCLAFFPSMLVPLVGCIFVIRSRRSDNRWVVFLFTMLGASISFFDFLDNPILSWGVPASILLAKLAAEKSTQAKNMLMILLISGLSWLFGYAFIWLAKLVLASLVLSQNALADALSAAQFRVGLGESDEATGIEAVLLSLKKNIVFDKHATLAIAFVLALLLAKIAWLSTSKAHGAKSIPWLTLAAFLVIAITPYIWFAVLSNHSVIHTWFTYRNQILTLFALGTAYCFLPKYMLKKGRGQIS